jgi:putative SOS response-associated peptidase YedK
MCNRYELHYQLDAEYQALLRIQWQLDFTSYNVCPTQSVPIVRTIDGERRGDLVRWGLIPFFAKGDPGKFLTTNARRETVTTSPSYRGPWKRGQRCLQLASGFYEWHTDAGGRKAPYHITVVDQPLFAFASLWDRSVKPDGTMVESCTIITMPANALMHDIHNTGNNPHRMPAILRREDWETWLTGSPDEAMAVLEAYSADLMVAYEVSARVNSPKNNDAKLIEPVPARA